MLARIDTPLKRIMAEEGRTQAWLARRLNVKPQTVWSWIHGIHEPEQATRETIAEALGRTTEELWPQTPFQEAA